jgi:hypothetical protein
MSCVMYNWQPLFRKEQENEKIVFVYSFGSVNFHSGML